jgi:predicted nucleic acid-binding protein
VKLAYVDTSCLVAIAFGEPGAAAAARRLDGFDRLFTSNLLEAEFISALIREGVEPETGPLTAGLSWVLPDRPLTPEFRKVASAGHLRGADLWHLGCALFLDPAAQELTFLTLDKAQRRVAGKLGFDV